LALLLETDTSFQRILEKKKSRWGVDANFAPHPTRRRPVSLTELAVTLQQGMQFLIDD
jgi:hypothetical protein